MKRILLIVNPKAGKNIMQNHLLAVTDLFIKAQYRVEVYVTQKAKDAMLAARDRTKDIDLVVCSGGDGTLNEVVTGVIKSGIPIPIGYIPCGSTNDFANTLRLPKNPQKAAEVILQGKAFCCDIGSFNKDIFVYVAAFGLFTDVSYGTDQELKNALGHLAYVLEGMKRLTAVQSYHMEISSGQEIITGEFLLGLVTNSDSVGGFKNITGEHVDLSDGQLEVTLIKKPATIPEWNKLIAALLDKNPQNELIVRFHTNRVSMESKEEVAWTLDGEFGGTHKSVFIEDHRGAVKILVPEGDNAKLGCIETVTK